MPQTNEDWDGPERRILMEALRLGFEVGFRGQIESLEWVRSRYQELESEASRLGLIDDLIQKYEAGKRFGKKRRLFSALSAEGGFIFQKKRAVPGIEESNPDRINLPRPVSLHDIIFPRVPSKDAIEVLANIMKLAEKSEKLREKVDLAFAYFADAHDRLTCLMQSHSDPAETLTEGLQILADLGWLRGFDVTEIDPDRRSAIVDAESAIALLIGQAKEPLCKPLCVILESIGTRAFGFPISVRESRCICQGDRKCRFVFSPRSLR